MAENRNYRNDELKAKPRTRSDERTVRPEPLPAPVPPTPNPNPPRVSPPPRSEAPGRNSSQRTSARAGVLGLILILIAAFIISALLSGARKDNSAEAAQVQQKVKQLAASIQNASKSGANNPASAAVPAPTAMPVPAPTEAPAPTPKIVYIPVQATPKIVFVTPSPAPASGNVRASGDVFIRSGPARHYEKLGVLKSGSRAEYLNERCADERGVIWYRIRRGDCTGWVSSRYSYVE